MKELRGMMKYLMRSQKCSSSTSLNVPHSDADIIPLDTYAINRPYGNYPSNQERYGYGQDLQGDQPARRSDFPNRRSQTRQLMSSESDRTMRRVTFATGGVQERGGMVPNTFDDFSNSDEPPHPRSTSTQLIVGPNGSLYYSVPNPVVCYYCGEEGHMRPHCPKLRPYGLSSTSTKPVPARPDSQRMNNLIPPPVAGSNQAGSVVEIVVRSSALDGMKVREVTTTEMDQPELKEFVRRVEEVDDGDDLDTDVDSEEEGTSDMAGERAHCFSELPPEFDAEPGLSSQRARTSYAAEGDEEEEEVIPVKRKGKWTVPRAPRKPIRMMVTRQKFDFVGAFCDSPVTGLNWGSFFDLAPSVKRDICHQLVQEGTRAKRKGNGKGKKVTIKEVQDES